MHRALETEVLVVGAGPSGLLTAVLLVEAGVDALLVDREQRPATRSYACGLHPSSLKLLARLGLLDELLELGRRLDRVVFYSADKGREAEVSLGALPTEFPFVLVLPQEKLEALLAARLGALGGRLLWHHRFSAMQAEPGRVVAEVDQLVGTATGSAVPRWHWVVGRTLEVRARFVVGADGHHSLVRQLLDLQHDHWAPAELYVAYEFAAAKPLPDELAVVLTDHTKSVLWPLPGGRCRWSFQLTELDDLEFPDKDRQLFWSESPPVAQQTRERLQQRLQARAPWFPAEIPELDWAADIQFQNRLVRQYGRDLCWLVGDAAHQTAPGGIQSMNVGLLEAADLAGRLGRILRGEGGMELLAEYDRTYRETWRRLLGAQGALTATDATRPWVKNHRSQLLSSLPASGPDLPPLLQQLGLTWT